MDIDSEEVIFNVGAGNDEGNARCPGKHCNADLSCGCKPPLPPSWLLQSYEEAMWGLPDYDDVIRDTEPLRVQLPASPTATASPVSAFAGLI